MIFDLALHIDGEWLKNDGRHVEEVINPATGKPIAELPHATKDDLNRALSASAAGFQTWRSTSAYDRARVLRNAANILRERSEGIARILTQEQGKVLSEARAEISVTADIIDWMAEEGRRSYGRVVSGRARNVRQMVLQEPVGVTLALTPWNFPAMMPGRKIAAALAAGCSIIVKASEETPSTAVELVRCFIDAGLPRGVLNLVFGVPAEISEHLIASPTIRKISFTGSVAIGKQLAGLAAKGMKRTTLELGGHAPVVVFQDADVEKAADTIAAFKFRNAGQVCIAPTRFYIQESIYDRFLKRFVDFTKGIKIGDGLEKDSIMGPLANSRRLEAMEAIVADTTNRGGKIITGGKRHGNQGYFFEPTILTELPDDSKVMTEEPFGPIAPIVRFKAFDEVVERANSLPYGLAAYAFTSSVENATRIGDAIESGMVGINSIAISTPETPFGGVKESGHGHESGIEGLEAYTVKKFISQA